MLEQRQPVKATSGLCRKQPSTAIANNLRTFLGGASVSLNEQDKNETQAETAGQNLFESGFEIDGIDYLFRAQRKHLAFTSTEKDFIGELFDRVQGTFFPGSPAKATMLTSEPRCSPR